MIMKEIVPKLLFATLEAFRGWLGENAATSGCAVFIGRDPVEDASMRNKQPLAMRVRIEV